MSKLNPAWCCCSVAQSCPAVCDPVDCGTPGFPVLHHLPELAQSHVHWVSDATISSSVFPFSSCLQSFPASGSFLMSRLFPSGGQSTGASASASVLPVNTQGWFPLGWTGWISLQSKGDSCLNSWFCFSWLIMPYHHWVCLRDVGVRQTEITGSLSYW